MKYCLFSLLLQNNDDLKQYGIRDDFDYKKTEEGKRSHFKMIQNIMDGNFWYYLEDIIEILRLLNEC